MRIVFKLALGIAAFLGAVAVLFFGVFLWNMHSTSTHLKNEASVLIERFHRNYNIGDFRAMCADINHCPDDPRIEALWKEEIEAVRQRFGSYNAPISAEIQPWLEPLGARARLLSKFQSGDASEQFDFIPVLDGGLRIATFQVKEN